MKGGTLVAVLLSAGVGLAVAARPAAPQPPPRKRLTVFSTLTVGQAVTLNERAGLYVVGTLGGIEAGTHTVAEVGDDYLSVTDVAGLTETRIPASAVRAVVHTKPR